VPVGVAGRAPAPHRLREPATDRQTCGGRAVARKSVGYRRWAMRQCRWKDVNSPGSGEPSYVIIFRVGVITAQAGHGPRWRFGLVLDGSVRAGDRNDGPGGGY
jgi:hypothetical protein